jgi:hypothetical protein
MGTNKDPDIDRATDVDDNTTLNRRVGGNDTDASDDLGGDTDKDPDITGKSFDPRHNTLRMRNRSESKDQGISDSNAGPARGDATRGPTNQPHGPRTE